MLLSCLEERVSVLEEEEEEEERVSVLEEEEKEEERRSEEHTSELQSR